MAAKEQPKPKSGLGEGNIPPSKVQQVAERLTSMGYFVVPLLPATKKAAGQQWQKYRLKESDISYFFKPDNGIGLLLGIEATRSCYPVAIDVDVDDKDLITNIECAFSHRPPAKKGAKGITFFAYTRESIKKRMFKRNNGVGQMVNCVEILAEGQQTVIPPSIHPSTNKPYIWIGEPLTDVHPEQLPELTESVMKEIQLAVEKPDSKIFLLNKMQWLGRGQGGTVHDDTILATGFMVSKGWTEDEIWNRVLRATKRICNLAGTDYFDDFPTWEQEVRERMLKPAFEKKYDEVTKKVSPAIQAAKWLLEMWRGPNVFNRDGVLFAYQDGFYEKFTQADMRHVLSREYKGAAFDHGQLHNVVMTALDMSKRFPKVRTRRVCMNNGTFDMDTGLFTNWSPDDYLISRMNFDYDPDAACPVYDKVVRRALAGHGEADTDRAVLCFEQYAGHTLFECLDYHKFLVIKGQPRTGKSTLVKLIKSLHSHGSYSAVAVHNFDSERFRTHMVGKLVNLTLEVEATTHAADGFLKSVTAGDVVTVRFLYQEPDTVVLPVRFVIACNEMFRIRDTSGAIEARMLLLSCDNFLPQQERDPDMELKLEKERTGIFNQLVKAWEQLRNDGMFTEPTYSSSMIGEFSMENNHAMQWMRERTVEGQKLDASGYKPNLEMIVGTEQSILYMDYVEWSRLNGFKNLSSISFGMKLSQIKIDGFPLDSITRWVGGRAIRVRPLTLVVKGNF